MKYAATLSRNMSFKLEIVNKAADLEQNIKSPFKCRKEECNKQYVSHSTRVMLVDEL